VAWKTQRMVTALMKIVSDESLGDMAKILTVLLVEM
jgi:hypothetical protein